MFSSRQTPKPTKASPTPKAHEESPFAKPDKFSDVTFNVQSRNLYFCKTLLKIASPVFVRMFEGQFKEKEAGVIPLPGKTYEEVDLFLRQLHPIHCWKAIEDDHIGVLLKMADEYEVTHLYQRCQEQIVTSMNGMDHDKLMKESFDFDHDKMLFYLRLCDEHNLQEGRTKAMQLLARRSKVKDWERTEIYQSLKETTKNDLMKERCVHLEEVNPYS